MKTLQVIAFLVLAVTVTSGRRFERCELARTLHNRYGFARNQLADWICLVEHESSFDTKAVGPPNDDGSKDWGLFQINDRYWCQSDNYRNSANMCHERCENFRSSDISASVDCVRKIFREHGFAGWNGWKHHCHSPPSVEHCFVGYDSGCYGGGMMSSKHY